MMNRRKSLLLCALLVMALAAIPALAEVTEDFHKTLPMDSDGILTLKNVNGNVTLEAWEKNEIQIDAHKVGRNEEKLRDARIVVMGSGHTIDIETKYPDHANNSATVDYTIHVPKNAQLRDVASVNGSVHVNGVRGRVKATTVNGSVEVWSAAGELEATSVNGEVKAGFAASPNKRVKLTTVNGGVSVMLPAAANAHVKASTVNGSISSDLPITIEKHKYAPGASVDCNLNNGGEVVELETVNGSIYLHKS